MPEGKLRVRFWGVRGSTPTPQAESLKFGGNTACVELRTPSGDRLIFDAGSGIRALGKQLLEEAAGGPIHTDIFLTHFHWDHIQGLPFFAPLYGASNSVTFHSGHTSESLQDAIEGQMTRPYYPIGLAQVAAQRAFRAMKPGAPLEIGGVAVLPFALNHPQGATGYRIESGNSVIVYATDYEPGNSDLDAVLLANARDADILICDAQYTPEEYESHRGWGHGSWLDNTKLAREAGAKHLILFHHDPDHDDDTMARIETEARGEFPNSIAAREGLIA